MTPARFAAALALVALPVLAAPVAATAAPAVTCDAGSDSAFSFVSYDADFTLDTDDAGRSVLETVETFVAQFPDIDQNQGMRRAIPLEYQGAPTDITDISVTDGDGAPRPFTAEEDEDGEFLLVTSRADECVHGEQTYVFGYTQHNVTRYFADTDSDEFYWDTNGTGWDQQFGSATSRIHVPAALAASLTGEAACYRGGEGSERACDLAREENGEGVVFTTTESALAARENVTVSLGFAPHTFVPRDDSYFGSPLGFLQALAVAVAVATLVWAIVLRRTRLADGRGRPTIIAEYSPPEGLDLFTAAAILGKTQKAAAAAFLNLAVTRRMRISEHPKTTLFGRDTYTFELVDASGLSGPELDLAKALFGYQLEPGTSYEMTGKDTTLSERVRAIIKAAQAGTVVHGLRKKGTTRFTILPGLFAVIAAVGSFFAGVALLESARGGAIPGVLLALPILLVVVVWVLLSRSPLTERGAELRDHLEGLELYIRLAEADRLRMLQSPDGAERQGEIIRVYEKLLPYAVLFGLEKEWAGELGKYYVDETPDYYAGSGAFNAAVFASSVGALSSSVATSFSGSSSSSSSGGSGGGGSSGGGGGGGGGGGV